MDDRMPVLVGGGQVTQKGVALDEARGPMALMVEAVERALEDAGIQRSNLDQVDLLASINPVRGLPKNPGEALATLMGFSPKRHILSVLGGNWPQGFVNYAAEQIAEGAVDFAIIAGSEALNTSLKAMQAGFDISDWYPDTHQEPDFLGPNLQVATDEERLYHCASPIETYPLFENAIRGAQGWTIEEHKRELGKLMAPFTEVAAQHANAWFPIARSAEEIYTATADNRMIGFPYTKYLNAIMNVDQSAAVIVMSVEKARALQVPEDRWVYLHGCGDGYDNWYVADRVNYYESPAIEKIAEKTWAMSGLSAGDVSFFDFYSCFPSAVQMGRDAFGIPRDVKPLTVTGGLSYFGGAGNNYTTHAIATMMDIVRDRPGKYGLVTGNGGNVTKHSAGIYSTVPVEGSWKRELPAAYQPEIDALKGPVRVTEAEGAATLETYTVMYDREGPAWGLVIGRLEDDRRFLSLAPDDKALLENMTTEDPLGIAGKVSFNGTHNIFTPA